MATDSTKSIIALSAPVTISAAEGEKKGPATFTTTFYTGGALEIEGWDHPVAIDLAGLTRGNVLVANLDHDRTKRVGNFDVANNGQTLVANGTASAATAARDEVVNSAKEGYVWQSSLEVNPQKVEEVKAGKTVTVNGQELTGPLYITRKGTLKGFAFVSHGADDNTSVTIAATAASMKGNAMKAEVKAWAEGMGIDVDSASPEAIATIEANYEGKNGKKAGPVKASDNPFEARKLEAQRQSSMRAIADKFIEKREGDLPYIESIEEMYEHAIEAKMTPQEFRSEMYEALVPLAHTVAAPKGRDQITSRILEAAIAKTGRLANIEKVFDSPTLEAADKHFKDGISLTELFHVCAEANGYRGRRTSRVDLEVQRAAFGMSQPGIRAQGWSTISISNILSNNQNKFIREGWNAVDMTPLQLAAVRSVTDFREITTISLTGHLQFEKVGPAGEIKHGTLGDATTGNKADTYGLMLAITRQDIINDDLNALTAVPRKLGRGGALKLADIFWAEFLNPTTANFFHANNSNVNTGVADMTAGGLAATEAIFMAQTDPDGKPLSLMPRILVVPTALYNAALTLQTSDRLYGSSGPDGNIWKGRFRVVTSPYLSNSSYTGYSAVAWYMLADPSDLPMIEIVALNGRVEPTVDTADTDFNTLGVQFRGYSDIGVRVQETRAAVRADGGSS